MTEPNAWLQIGGFVLGAGQAIAKVAQYLFSYKKGDIEICHTRVMRVKAGLPWNEQIGVHPLSDGRLELTPIREEPEAEFDAFSRAEYYDALKKVSRKTKK